MAVQHRTARTRIWWSTLAGWLEAAYALERRRSGTLNKRRKQLHVEALPISLIENCTDAGVLTGCRSLLRNRSGGFAQPLRGQRESAPHTTILVAINNRLAQLEHLGGDCSAEGRASPFDGAMVHHLHKEEENEY
jgi:hypothetical protein